MINNLIKKNKMKYIFAFYAKIKAIYVLIVQIITIKNLRINKFIKKNSKENKELNSIEQIS